MDASRVYVRARALGCFQSYQYPNHSEGADCVGGQLRGDKECPFSGVTKSGRVWRKVPENDALEEGAGKRCSECALVPVPGKLSHAHRQDREATSRNAHQYNPDDVQLTGELNIVKPAAYVDGRLLCVQGHTD